MTEPASVNAAPVENGVATSEEQPGTKVFAGNLAYTTTDEGLKTFFSPVADDIVSAQVIFRGTRSAGYGFVAFKTAEAAEKAVELLNKKELDGRTLIVEVAKPTDEKREKKQKRVPKKRVSKKPKANGEATTPEATENKDSGAATESADGAAKTKKKRNTPRKAKKPRAAAKEGEAQATNGDAAAAAAPASEAKPKKTKAPRPPRERKPARPVGETPAGEPSKTMLFVANLGFSVDDANLSELFTGAGITVVSARVVRRRWGGRRSKGYGFVDVGSEDEQKKALELLQGKQVEGREIAVKIAVNAQEKEAEAEAESGAVPSMIPA